MDRHTELRKKNSLTQFLPKSLRSQDELRRTAEDRRHRLDHELHTIFPWLVAYPLRHGKFALNPLYSHLSFHAIAIPVHICIYFASVLRYSALPGLCHGAPHPASHTASEELLHP